MLTDVQWDGGMALKFHSARRVTIAAWDALTASRGSVAVTSGTSALTPKASLAAVGTINAAILALAKTFADRGINDGIQVNTILPGSVITDRRRSMLQDYADTHGLELDAATERFAAEMGIARYGRRISPTPSPSCSRPTAGGRRGRRYASMAEKRAFCHDP